MINFESFQNRQTALLYEIPTSPHPGTRSRHLKCFQCQRNDQTNLYSHAAKNSISLPTNLS